MGFENIHPVELRSTYNVKQNSHFICLGYELDWCVYWLINENTI